MALPHLLNARDFEEAAKTRLDKVSWEYFNDGSEDGAAVAENLNAFTNYKIRPRCLRDVSSIDTTTTVAGVKLPFPIAVAPSAMHRMVHPDGEIATAKGAARSGTAICLSTLATTSLEDVKSAGDEVGENLYMLQLYVYDDRSATEALVARAEKAGYRALMLTVDTPVLGIRYNMIRNKFKLAPHLSLPNHEQNALPSTDQRSSKNEASASTSRGSMTWEETLPWLRSITKMEIWLKGVTTAEDVELAINSPANISGIVVSNHGGRQLESALATLDSLPECVEAARKSPRPFQVWVDGGIQKGSDVFKALALGADGVMVGKLALWGLAAGGEDGVAKAMDILTTGLRHTMALAGCPRLADITPSHLARATASGGYLTVSK